MAEWSLIVFTLAVQIAAGLALAVTWLDRTAALPDGVLRPLGVAIFPLAASGLAVSLLHLGRPLSAWKSLLNLGSSRLSLEVLVTLLFVTAALFYSHAWWVHRAEHRFLLGVVTSALAAAAVAACAAIYLIPTQPAWNSAWVPVSFFGSALLLGGCAAAAFADPHAPRSLLGCSLAEMVAGSLLLIIAAIWMIAALSHGAADDYAAARLQDAMLTMASRYPVWLGLHLLLAGMVPIAAAALLWYGRAAAGTSSWARLLVFVAVACGAIIGRKLMYLLATSPPGL